jgi:hypothetical protein
LAPIDQVEERHGGCGIERHARPELTQKAADGRTDDEAQTEGRTHLAEGFAALFGWGDVGDIGVGDDP